jgi:hypothetical protein
MASVGKLPMADFSAVHFGPGVWCVGLRWRSTNVFSLRNSTSFFDCENIKVSYFYFSYTILRFSSARGRTNGTIQRD